MTDAQPAESPLPDFDNECFRGAKLVDEGKLEEAAEVFRTLSERADLAEGTRCVMAVNLATVYEKMGHLDTAIQTYEYATGLVLRGYTWIEERRAQFLFEHDRAADAIEVWEGILALPFLTDDTVKRIEHNIKTARAKQS